MTALAYALKVIEIGALAVDAGLAVKQVLDSGQQAVRAMVAENRDPTPTEWDELNKQLADLRVRLHGE